MQKVIKLTVNNVSFHVDEAVRNTIVHAYPDLEISETEEFNVLNGVEANALIVGTLAAKANDNE